MSVCWINWRQTEARSNATHICLMSSSYPVVIWNSVYFNILKVTTTLCSWTTTWWKDFWEGSLILLSAAFQVVNWTSQFSQAVSIFTILSQGMAGQSNCKIANCHLLPSYHSQRFPNFCPKKCPKSLLVASLPRIPHGRAAVVRSILLLLLSARIFCDFRHSFARFSAAGQKHHHKPFV